MTYQYFVTVYVPEQVPELHQEQDIQSQEHPFHVQSHSLFHTAQAELQEQLFDSHHDWLLLKVEQSAVMFRY